MKEKETVFSVTNLTKIYKKRTIVKGISFCGYKGEILGFLGPNGAGKTTTIRMMTGLIAKNEGTVLIRGFDISTQFEEAIRHTGAIVETPSLYENMTGKQNLIFFANAKGAGKEQLEKMIDLTGLGKRLDDKVKGYSLGMKQRLAIGAALLASPSLLILDEPTNGLDPVAIRDLRLFLQKLSHEDGVCVFISSHMLWEMEKLCDRVLILTDGAIIGEADIEKIQKEGKNLEEYYIKMIEENMQTTEETEVKKGKR